MKVDLIFWLIIALSTSITANILCFWYIRGVLAKLMTINENLGDLSEMVQSYQEHLSDLYSLEQYYGDNDMKLMLSHTKGLVDVLNDYNEISKLTTLIEEEPEPAKEITEEETTSYAETQITEENVFYAGTRKRDN